MLQKRLIWDETLSRGLTVRIEKWHYSASPIYCTHSFAKYITPYISFMCPSFLNKSYMLGQFGETDHLILCKLISVLIPHPSVFLAKPITCIVSFSLKCRDTIMVVFQEVISIEVPSLVVIQSLVNIAAPIIGT